MKEDDLAGIPKEGFLKVSSQRLASLSGEQKTALIRRGNELFNAGEFEQAKRIFLTTGYTDGIIRMGDHYFAIREPLEALRMYWLAPAPDKRDLVVERIARVLRKLLVEERSTGK